MKNIILKLIHFYRENLSFVFRLSNTSRGCRFFPSCSEYSCQAIEKYGLIKGLAKSFKRIVKCNPFNGGGIDLC
jgi:putative membrane protein insertion efficiency factor